MALADTAKLVASLELQDKFSGPARGIEGSIGGLERRVSTLSRVGSEASRGIGVAGQNLSRFGLIAGGIAVAGLVASVNAASDLNESISKSKVVFGDAAAQVDAFAVTAASKLGLSRQAATEAAATFGNLFHTTGLTGEASADMSIKLVQLAGDLASFNNIDPAEALEKLRSGLLGEAEPLRSVGVLLTEAAVKAEAYRIGLAKQGAALTEGQKVQARYSLILQQTTQAQGDAGRTIEQFAGQQRVLKATLTDVEATIGTALLPTLNTLLLKFNTLLTQHTPDIQRFADSLPGVADRVQAVLGGLPWGAIGSAFELMGKGAQAALSAFETAPPWLQTAILTGWGLNKLTGGALGNIVGILGQGLIKGVLGMNAGVVNINAGVVNGVGGVPGVGGTPAAGTGGIVRQVAGAAVVAGGGLAIGGIIGGAIQEGIVAGARAAEDSAVTRLLNQNTTTRDDLQHAIDTIDGQLTDIKTNQITQIAAGSSEFAGLFTGQKGVITTLIDQRAALVAKLEALDQTTQDGVSEFKKSRATLADLQRPLRDQVLAIQQADAAQRGQNNAILAAAARAASSGERTAAESANIARYTGIDAAKPPPSFAVTIPVTAVANINVNGFLRTVTSAWIASASGGGGPALDPTKLY